eukprot:g35617.t1
MSANTTSWSEQELSTQLGIPSWTITFHGFTLKKADLTLAVTNVGTGAPEAFGAGDIISLTFWCKMSIEHIAIIGRDALFSAILLDFALLYH